MPGNLIVLSLWAGKPMYCSAASYHRHLGRWSRPKPQLFAAHQPEKTHQSIDNAVHRRAAQGLLHHRAISVPFAMDFI